jgi:peptide chain release factor 1
MLTIEVRPGEGGEDAEAFASELVTTITSIVRRLGGDSTTETDAARTTTISVRDELELDWLAGVHRIQRIPKNDRRGRRHTSTATVNVLGEVHVAEVDLTSVRYEMFSGSGPGGQHRNKSQNCVRAIHPSGVTATSTEHRSQFQNQKAATAELVRRLQEQSESDAADAVNSQRNIAAGREAKTWTWNTQRSEVVAHHLGRKWPLGRFSKGQV